MTHLSTLPSEFTSNGRQHSQYTRNVSHIPSEYYSRFM